MLNIFVPPVEFVTLPLVEKTSGSPAKAVPPVTSLPAISTCAPPSVTLTDASFTRSEEHTSELQSLMRISYAVFCLKKKITVFATLTTVLPHTMQLYYEIISFIQHEA